MSNDRQLNVKQAPQRPKRTNLAGRNRLSITNQDPNYVYRIAAVDSEARITRVEDLKAMGWEVVPGVDIGEQRADIGKGIGRTGVISVGGGATGVPMRIPRDWYDEYQKEKQGLVDQSAEEIRKNLEPNK